MDSSVFVALITSSAGIVIALIGAYFSSDRAVSKAVATVTAEKDALIHRYREQILMLGGDPDDA